MNHYLLITIIIIVIIFCYYVHVKILNKKLAALPTLTQEARVIEKINERRRGGDDNSGTTNYYLRYQLPDGIAIKHEVDYKKYRLTANETLGMLDYKIDEKGVIYICSFEPHENAPEIKKISANVNSKEIKKSHVLKNSEYYSICFLLADRTYKELTVDAVTYNGLRDGDEGILTYREQHWFISFQRGID